MGVHGDGHHLGPDRVEEVEHRREGGLLDEHDVTQSHGQRGEAVERVHGAVDDA